MVEQSVWRILDVNSNRAAEGLRTLEDVARLVREDAVAAAWIKALRHDLAESVSKLNRTERLGARSTEHDAGTQLTSDRERERVDWRSIVTAACERVLQSLRCLEEFAKLVDPNVGEDFKALRYRAYDQLAQLELRWSRSASLSDARLYLLVDCTQSVDAFAESIKQFAEAGVDLFQLRDKTCDGGKLVAYARAAMAALDGTQAKLIINDRVDIALACGAAGVHLGQEDMSLADARRIAGRDMWIGISTHSIEQAVAAELAGADYIGCGPTFPSSTKSFAEFPGLNFLSAVRTQISIPAFAIGGIDSSNLASVINSGVRRVALSSAIHRSEQPFEEAATIKKRLIGE